MSSLIKNAKLVWNEQGEPSAVHFDDAYFSVDDGLKETEYVFLFHNKLLSRWKNWSASYFVIGETGFGSGLNFLATIKLFTQWRKDNPAHCLTRLYFISFEKYPLTPNDLANAHSRWPELSEYAGALQQQYPSPIAGNHRLEFQPCEEISVVLDLWYGDIKDTLPSLHYGADGLVDCWYLDGFAPSKNKGMWNQTLYNNMANCSKDDATLATFTAAGVVRRGLISAGFNIVKVKGFGRKREMLTGQFSRVNHHSSQSSWFFRAENISAKAGDNVTIVGGGIASASLALALAKRKINITLICQDHELAQGASGNRQGGFYPLVNVRHDPLSQFYTQAFSFAVPRYQRMIHTTPKAGALCGVLQLAFDQKHQKRQQQILEQKIFPTDILNGVDHKQASELAGVTLPHSALHYPRGGWMSPLLLTHSLIGQAKRHVEVTIIHQRHIDCVEHRDHQWKLYSDNTLIHSSNCVILANGHQLSQFEQTRDLPLYATSGQVSHLSNNEQSKNLNKVLCYSGYITPIANGSHCIGASFNRDCDNRQLSPDEQQQNISKLRNDTNNSSWTASFANAPIEGKIGVRMSVKDHLPMVGHVPHYDNTLLSYSDLNKGKPSKQYPNAPIYPGLFMLGGLGSRGICSAPLLADILTAQLTGEPQPASQSLLNQLSPNRYWIKQLKRGSLNEPK